MGWVILTVQVLSLLLLLWLVRQSRMTSGLTVARAADAADVSRQIAALRDRMEALPSQLQAMAPPPPPPEAYPAGTVFLPNDASEADLERMLKQAEDRSLVPGPFSSRPSAISPERSRRAPSTRPGRPFGSA